MKQLYKIFILMTLISCSQRKEISPIFYEVKSEKGKVYILGSIHVSDGSIFPLPKYIMDGFYESKGLVMEIKPLDKDTLLSRVKKVEDSYCLKDHVSFETFQLVQNISKYLSIPNNILTSLQPLEIIQLVEEYELTKIGINTNKGIESFFYYLAKEKNIKVDGFQSYSKILKINQTVSPSEKEKMLVDYLNNRHEIAKETKQILEFWKSGNEEELLEKVKSFSSKYSNISEKLLLERNQIITEKIINILEESEIVFITVGLGHLIGEDNIIESLRARNYIISKI